MSKVATSVTLFNDPVGLRMSITYAEVDETNGRILKDNIRLDRIAPSTVKKTATNLFNIAQETIDSE